MKKTMSGIISFVLLCAVVFTSHTAFAEEIIEPSATSTLDTIHITATSTEATSTIPTLDLNIGTTTNATSTDQTATSTQATSTNEIATSTPNGTGDTASTTPTSVLIHLRIETPDQTLFNSDITVNACQPTSTGATTTNAYCALEQTGIATRWSFWGSQAFLDSFGDYANNANGNGIYWLWLPNYEYTNDAFNEHILTPGETIFAHYNTPPLRVTARATSTETGATTTLSISAFGFDENWNPAWTPVATSTLLINDIPFEASSSSIDFGTTTPGAYTIIATKSGYATSVPAMISVIQTQAPTTTGTSSNETQNTGGSNNTNTGANNTIPTPTFNIDKAIQFLVSQQQADGSFGSSLYTDWAAIALGSYQGQHEAKQKLISYLISHPENSALVTDSERHAMALMALGINPYSGTNIDYIKKITDSFDGTQIGDPNLYNDDIFALFPLLKAGYTSSDPIISKTVQFILSKQSSQGAWMSVDMTSAAIQALSQVGSQNGVSPALQKAKEYLKSQQNQGGFGTSYATSWALQAISALGETSAQWSQNNTNPLTYLTGYQQQDGGVENSENISNRIWATSYAVPGALGKPWPTLLSSFARPQPVVVQNPVFATTTNLTSSTHSTSSGQASTPQATTTPTTTVATLVRATTTPATSSPLTNIPKVTTSQIKKVVEKAEPKASSSSEIKATSTPEGSSQLAAVGARTRPTKTPFVVGVMVIALLAISVGIYKYNA